MGAYLKKKTLDPLDTYVAPLIAAKDELKSSCSVAGVVQMVSSDDFT